MNNNKQKETGWYFLYPTLLNLCLVLQSTFHDSLRSKCKQKRLLNFGGME